jgi:dipeptidyl aminopeptidase/acylaminoacyl peptidase
MRQSVEIGAVALRCFLVAACLTAPLAARAESVAADSVVAARGAARTPLTHEALWMMKRVEAAVVSPDGKWAVYSVTEPSYEQDKAVSDLWLVPTDGKKAPRRITNTRAAEEDVTWSPDSGSIAFATKREGDEVEQIYVLDLAAGGEARRLTNLSTGAHDPLWRPDGKAMLFESFVYPNAPDDAANKKIAADIQDRKYNVRTYEHFPVRFWNHWLDERQPTILVQSLEPGASAKDILSPTAFAKTDGFSGRETISSVTLAPLWSPDGREVVFTATTEHWNAAFAHVAHHLYRLSADGGSEPTLVSPAGGDYDDVRFSPDGNALYFNYTLFDDEVYHLPRLSRVQWPAGGATQWVARDFDRQASHFALTPDSKSVYLLVPEAAGENLYRVPAAGGVPALFSRTWTLPPQRPSIGRRLRNFISRVPRVGTSTT